MGETIEADPGVGVGQSEALEGGEDVGAGRDRGAAFGEESGELFVVADGVAGLGFDQSEDQ
ncbi:MAG: hypothetical protein ACRDMX_10685 [Solirubrobacteraceae bacterium]